MKLFIPLPDIDENNKRETGSKAFNLCRMGEGGVVVPDGICITTEAYRLFIDSSPLREWIPMEINRKKFEDMRWEEMWDTALRIRNKFLTTPVSPELLQKLKKIIRDHFADKNTVVRSSAIDEDSAGVSFAGLHESYINITGIDEILKHIKLVWASLWSDAALLYRKEFNLAPNKSAMAVIIQELVEGEKSGVAFGKNPNNESTAVIEAVFGLNKGMVDGTVEPDRWILSRDQGNLISHKSALKEKYVKMLDSQTDLEVIPEELKDRPVLNRQEVDRVFLLAMKAEEIFGKPQDVEWTLKGDNLFCLQSRPITTGEKADAHADDKRPWYMTLRRSFDNLKQMRHRIENQLIPEMIRIAGKMSETDLNLMSDEDLSFEIERRKKIHEHWVKVYWDEYIPFAHGVRLFGQVYNDTVKPDDPYEFVQILLDTGMVSINRNNRISELAEMIRNDTELLHSLKKKKMTGNMEYKRKLQDFLKDFGFMICNTFDCKYGKDNLETLLIKMAESPVPSRKTSGGKEKEAKFLSHFDEKSKDYALELLDLARASYRLRDDDNIHLGKIEGEVRRAVYEGNERLIRTKRLSMKKPSPDEIVQSLRDISYVPMEKEPENEDNRAFRLRARQLKGQPAGSGVARGAARVIISPDDLINFQQGEILVCDAIDPNMTFIVPLSSGIVERRGGMLIHGAIIAREYGIPCVTGIPDATKYIQTGDRITVDGYLGIVTVD